MSHSKTSQGNGASKAGNRKLPSWMGSRDNESESPDEKKPNGDGEGEERNEGEKPRQGKGRRITPSKDINSCKKSGASSSGATDVSKLLVLDSIECVFIKLHSSVGHLTCFVPG